MGTGAKKVGETPVDAVEGRELYQTGVTLNLATPRDSSDCILPCWMEDIQSVQFDTLAPRTRPVSCLHGCQNGACLVLLENEVVVSLWNAVQQLAVWPG